jgi:ketosteroid isomerase-like protein
MTAADETRRVVEGYFAAWTRGDVAGAYALLADDLTFVGPTAKYDSAAAFRPALERFAAMTRSARMTVLLVDGERAAMTYDCELPAPVGTIRIASFFLVAEGRIRDYETLFDATELRKLQPR